MSEPAEIPSPTPITFNHRKSTKIRELSVRLKMITPMFGGGAVIPSDYSHIRRFDEDMPFRGSAIRGHLRFWWRATAGVRYESMPAMKRQEDLIFGAPAKAGTPQGPSLISVRIDAPFENTATPIEVFQRKGKNLEPIQGREGLAYGAFPLRPNPPKQDNPFVKKDRRHSKENRSSYKRKNNDLQTTPGELYEFSGTFTLTITYPTSGHDKLHEELLLALSAWISFGGLGGRTRRGFGKLALASTAPDGILSPEDIFNHLPPPTNTELSKTVPHLSNSLDHRRKRNYSHEQALRSLMLFRQGPGIARKGKPNASFGARSHWPDADGVRLVGQSKHPKLHPRPPKIKKFPRAIFGLPIIFHFRQEDVRKGDPEDHHLQPVIEAHGGQFHLMERFPSPLIIAPQSPDSTYLLVLQGHNLERVSFKRAVTKNGEVPRSCHYEWQLNDNDLKELRPRSGKIFKNKNAVYGFLNFKP